MELTINLTRFDLIKLFVYLSLRKKINLILWIFGLILSYLIIHNPEKSDLMFEIVFCVTMATVFVVGSAFASLLLVLVYAKESNGILGKHVFKITDDGLHDETIADDNLYKWINLRKITKTKKSLIIKTGTGYQVIPNRFFKSNDERNSFANMLSEGISNN